MVRNKVEAAYMHSDLFERRSRLMDDWAGYLAGESRDREARTDPLNRRGRSVPGQGSRILEPVVTIEGFTDRAFQDGPPGAGSLKADRRGSLPIGECISAIGVSVESPDRCCASPPIEGWWRIEALR